MIRSALLSSRRHACWAFAAALALASPAAALAQGTPEQQQACAPDALRLCSDTIPDVAKTTACMKAHVGNLSPRCRTAFFAATGGAPARETAERPVQNAGVAKAAKPRSAAAERKLASRSAPPVRQPRVAARTASREEPREAIRPAMPEQQVMPTAGIADSLDSGAGVPGVAAAQANILASCRAGLIDPFTCRNTIRVFGLNSGGQ